ncbi:MAG TPA: SprB repeat-containing protein, partial [Bacteroidia bacterium]|nr:SprB repeat-containing protein [Bacteroidia bacterium]
MKNSVHCRNSALTVFLLFSLASARLHGQNSTSWTATYDSEKSFIENKGQFYPRQKFGPDNHVLYGYDGSCTRIFFEKQGVTFNFTQKSKSEEMDGPEKGGKFKSQEEFEREEKKEKAAVLKLDEVTYYWEGANPDAQVIAEEKTGNYFNYSFYVNGVEHNENNIYGFTKLIYKNLYPNIDVEYTFHPTDGIKYAIIVHPGGDVSKIKMVYSRGVSIGRNGDLHITTSFGDIIDHAPVTFYQDNPSEIISSRFVEKGKSISFGLGAFDGSRTIVIDPWTQTPVLNNSKKVWETETNSSGDVYIYGGDSFIKLLKYNSTGTLQWTYTSPWDSANYWIGGFITHPTTGESYMTSGSNGEIRKISNAGASVWSNNPNGLTSYEYWSLAFNCDLTQLVVAGTRLAFSIPTPVIRGVIMNINLASGAQLSTTVVGYGSTLSIPPNVQEVSSICYAPNGNFYYLTLDTMGCINNALTAVNFKVGTGYAFDYYIPGYGFGTKQPISAIRANATAVYTLNGATVEKRDLNTGAVLASAAIPGGSYTNTFGGRHVNGNGGIDIDNCGNVYVGSVNSVVKYDANLNFISSSPTSFAVYDVDVNSNGEVAACGWSGGTGYIQTLNMSACAQITYTCSLTSPLSVTSSQTNIQCFGQCTGSATVNVSGGTAPYTYAWSPSGGTAATASNLCVGTYTCTITDNASGTTTATFNITQPSAALSSTQSQVNVACSGGCNGSASVVASGGTAGYTYSWSPSGGSAATAGSLCNG